MYSDPEIAIVAAFTQYGAPKKSPYPQAAPYSTSPVHEQCADVSRQSHSAGVSVEHGQHARCRLIA